MNERRGGAGGEGTDCSVTIIDGRIVVGGVGGGGSGSAGISGRGGGGCGSGGGANSSGGEAGGSGAGGGGAGGPLAWSYSGAHGTSAVTIGGKLYLRPKPRLVNG